MADQPPQDQDKRSQSGKGQPTQPGSTESAPTPSDADTQAAAGMQDKPPAGGYGSQGGGYGAQSSYAAHGGFGSQGETAQGGAAFDPRGDGDKPGYDVSTAQVGSGAFTQGGTGRLGRWPQDEPAVDDSPDAKEAPKK